MIAEHKTKAKWVIIGDQALLQKIPEVAKLRTITAGFEPKDNHMRHSHYSLTH